MKKQINIILILVVLGIWGTAGYRYVSQYFLQKQRVSMTDRNEAIPLKIREKDTFALLPLQRDPFLNTTTASLETRPAKTFSPRKKMKTVVAPTTHLPFPEVGYFGYIKSNQQQKELVLLKVDNKLVKLRTGESQAGLKVIKIFRDSVRVTFGQETRTFRKNN